MNTLVAKDLPDPADSFPTPERAGSCLAISKRGFHNIAYVKFSGCGHAPALLDREQIGVVVDWLDPNED